MTAAGQTIDAETQLPFVWAKGVEKYIVDKKHSAQIYAKPQPRLFPTAYRAAASTQTRNEIRCVHIAIEELRRSGHPQTRGDIAALQRAQRDIVADADNLYLGQRRIRIFLFY